MSASGSHLHSRRNLYLPAPPKSLISINENQLVDSGRYAKALRAIGQALEALEVDVFQLTCEGENYLVRSRPRTIKNKWRQILHYLFPKRFPPVGLLIYTPDDIERLEQEGRSRRRNAGTDPNTLTQALRVVGFHVDQKNGRLVELSKSHEWIKIRYDTAPDRCNTEEFNLFSLYTLFMEMYVKRRDGRKVAAEVKDR
jgi:hypothetical protein